ncbi:MAG TPA: PH domain-containing protein [Streptosporangiaceae bacterium]
MTPPDQAGEAAETAVAPPGLPLVPISGGTDAVAAASPPGAGPAGDWRRLSRRSMIVRPVTDLVRLLPLLAGLLVLHSQTGGGVVWSIAAAAFAVVTGLVHWATTRYQITAERVYLRRGLLNQKTLSVARDRIRTVDVTAHVLHRVLGVCRVSIGTGRNDLRPGESFHLDGVTRAEADSLRVVLLSGLGEHQVAAAPADVARPAVSAARAAGVAGATAEEPAIVELELNWLRFAPLTLTGLVVLGVLFGAVIQITNDTQFNLAASGPVQRMVTDFTALSVVQRVVVGGCVAMAGYVLIAMIGYITLFWNFRLAGLGAQTLRVTRGLLSVRATTISMSRLRGVEISEPLLLRAAKGARCIAIATGLHIGRGAEREGSVLVPPAPRAVAHRVASLVLGASEAITSGPLRRHGPAARRRRYVRALAAAALLIALIFVATKARHGPSWVWAGSFILVPAALLVAADRYRSLGHLLADGWLISRTGSLARRRTIISADAIIGWRVHQTWFQRRLGLMTLTATTAAGVQHYSVRDVPVADGLALARAATGDLLLPFLDGTAAGDLPVAWPASPRPCPRPRPRGERWAARRVSAARRNRGLRDSGGVPGPGVVRDYRRAGRGWPPAWSR